MFNELKNKYYKIQSIYFGNKKSSPLSVFIYDKLNERKIRFQYIYFAKSRVEAWLNTQRVDKCKDLILEAFENYLTREGEITIGVLLLSVLDSRIIFTTKQRTKLEFSTFNFIMPWWVVIHPIQNF